jgi:hypothetical protein
VWCLYRFLSTIQFLLVILVTVTGVSMYYVRKRQRKRREELEAADANTTTGDGHDDIEIVPFTTSTSKPPLQRDDYGKVHFGVFERTWHEEVL